MAHSLGGRVELKVDLELVIAQVFERYAEFLDAGHIFDRQRNIIIDEFLAAADVVLAKSLVTDELGDLANASKKNLHTLLLGSLSSISKKVFHATIESLAKELVELHIDAKPFVCVGHQANVDDGHHILSLGHVWRPDDYDEILLGPWSQFESDALGQLLAHRVLDIPRFVLGLAVGSFVELFVLVGEEVEDEV